MERTLTYDITEKNCTLPIGLFLKSMGFSAGNLIALKKMPESILLNGRPAYVNAPLNDGDTVTVHIKESEASVKISPIALPLSIVYEDEDLLVLNKPADMPIHPSPNNYDNTLGNAVAYYYASRQIPYVFRCVNRLDRDTTGLTVLAKHMISGSILSGMVAEKILQREYLAIVSGTLPSSLGTIDVPIARKNGSVMERCIDFETGEKAVTHYQVLDRDTKRNLSLLLIILETGRTHQIRVHMKHLGCPLIGDYLYNPDTSCISRQALHSYRLVFPHPITKEAMHFTAPLPDDMSSLFPAFPT